MIIQRTVRGTQLLLCSGTPPFINVSHRAAALTEALTLAQTHRLLAEAVLVAVAAGVGERVAVVSRRVVEEEGETAVT